MVFTIKFTYTLSFGIHKYFLFFFFKFDHILGKSNIYEFG